jgi:hypothetical protein
MRALPGEKQIRLVHVFGGLLLEKTFCENTEVVPKFLQNIHQMINQDEVLTDSILFITEIITSQIYKEH